jgi:hypothetical protein
MAWWNQSGKKGHQKRGADHHGPRPAKGLRVYIEDWDAETRFGTIRSNKAHRVVIDYDDGKTASLGRRKFWATHKAIEMQYYMRDHGMVVYGPLPVTEIAEVTRIAAEVGYDLIDTWITERMNGLNPKVLMVLTSEESGELWRERLGYDAIDEGVSMIQGYGS